MFTLFSRFHGHTGCFPGTLQRSGSGKHRLSLAQSGTFPPPKLHLHNKTPTTNAPSSRWGRNLPKFRGEVALRIFELKARQIPSSDAHSPRNRTIGDERKPPRKWLVRFWQRPLVLPEGREMWHGCRHLRDGLCRFCGRKRVQIFEFSNCTLIINKGHLNNNKIN